MRETRQAICYIAESTAFVATGGLAGVSQHTSAHTIYTDGREFLLVYIRRWLCARELEECALDSVWRRLAMNRQRTEFAPSGRCLCRLHIEARAECTTTKVSLFPMLNYICRACPHSSPAYSTTAHTYTAGCVHFGSVRCVMASFVVDFSFLHVASRRAVVSNGVHAHDGKSNAEKDQ